METQRNHDGAGVEQLVGAFPGNQFKGEIGPALIQLIERDPVR
jgi:hypothetical protein